MHAARLDCQVGRAATATRAGAAIIPRGGRNLYAYVGCSGWYYWHWANALYPAGLPRNDWFGHYASRFRTVELNAPFYSWPTLATVRTWMRQIGRRKFTYTIKVNELITHTKRFARTDTLVKDFGLIADLLGEHFGCFLFQLPPSFHYTPPALERILRQLFRKGNTIHKVVLPRGSEIYGHQIESALRQGFDCVRAAIAQRS